MPTESSGRRARVLVVLGGARRGGLGQRLLDLARDELSSLDCEVRVHDLLADGFDPVLRLEDGQAHALPCDPASDALTARYQEDAIWSESLVFVHPVWWFAPPAILKGWIDRVLVHQVALQQQPDGPPIGLFGGKKMLVIQTFLTGRAIDRVSFLGVTSFFWKRVVGLPLGIQKVTRLALYGVDKLDETRLSRFESRIRRSLGALVAGSSRG